MQPTPGKRGGGGPQRKAEERPSWAPTWSRCRVSGWHQQLSGEVSREEGPKHSRKPGPQDPGGLETRGAKLHESDRQPVRRKESGGAGEGEGVALLLEHVE